MACCPVAFCSTMVDSETELTLHRFYHFVVYTTYKICGIHHLQYMAYAIFKGLFIQERLWNTPRTRLGLVVYTTYNIWLTPFSRIIYTRGVVEYTTYKVWVCGIHHIRDMAYAIFKDYLYKRGCGILHVQGLSLWYTPHTIYGIRHFQGLFIQEGLWNTPRTRFGFVVYTTYEIWHTPFSSFILYKRLWYTPLTIYGIHHVQDYRLAPWYNFVYKFVCDISHPTPFPPTQLHSLLSILFKRKTLFSLYTTFIDYIYTDIDIIKVKRKIGKIDIER